MSSGLDRVQTGGREDGFARTALPTARLLRVAEPVPAMPYPCLEATGPAPGLDFVEGAPRAPAD